MVLKNNSFVKGEAIDCKCKIIEGELNLYNMGCHTWFYVIVTKDKEEILELAQKALDSCKTNAGNKKMYQYAIDNQIEEPVLELAEMEVDGGHSHNWTVYKEVEIWSLEQYNKEHGTSYKSRFDKEVYGIIPLEHYSDEPRISGYPDKIVRSYEDMEQFMSTGFDDEEGQHHDFRYEQDRKERFMAGIKQFFTNHPEGIIAFG